MAEGQFEGICFCLFVLFVWRGARSFSSAKIRRSRHQMKSKLAPADGWRLIATSNHQISGHRSVPRISNQPPLPTQYQRPNATDAASCSYQNLGGRRIGGLLGGGCLPPRGSIFNNDDAQLRLACTPRNWPSYLILDGRHQAQLRVTRQPGAFTCLHVPPLTRADLMLTLKGGGPFARVVVARRC